MDFKEQLQEWDRTIQGYQDILDGKVALPEGHTMQSILWSYQTAQRNREQFLQDGIAHINGYQYGELFSNERVFEILSRPSKFVLRQDRRNEHPKADD